VIRACPRSRKSRTHFLTPGKSTVTMESDLIEEKRNLWLVFLTQRSKSFCVGCQGSMMLFEMGPWVTTA
jgi:hypothetical protein